jgi:hypothetical protein
LWVHLIEAGRMSCEKKVDCAFPPGVAVRCAPVDIDLLLAMERCSAMARDASR